MSPNLFQRSTVSLLVIGMSLFFSACSKREPWEKNIGGEGPDELVAGAPISEDSGYMLVGATGSGSVGSYDGWVVRIDRSGSVLWEKQLGGSEYDRFNDICRTPDGDYILVGQTSTDSNGKNDFWAIRMAQTGEIIWEKRYGGSTSEGAHSVIPLDTGGFLIGGYAVRSGQYLNDGRLIKISETGELEWQKDFGGESTDVIHKLVRGPNGGALMAGKTGSDSAGGYDCWVLAVDQEGNLLWERKFGGERDDEARSIVSNESGNFIIAGYSESYGKPRDKGKQSWLIEIDAQGNRLRESLIAQKDTREINEITEIAQTSSGDYILSATKWSPDKKAFVAWLLKIDKEFAILKSKSFGTEGINTLGGGVTIPKAGNMRLFWGMTESYAAGPRDGWIVSTEL